MKFLSLILRGSDLVAMLPRGAILLEFLNILSYHTQRHLSHTLAWWRLWNSKAWLKIYARWPSEPCSFEAEASSEAGCRLSTLWRVQASNSELPVIEHWVWSSAPWELGRFRVEEGAQWQSRFKLRRPLPYDCYATEPLEDCYWQGTATVTKKKRQHDNYTRVRRTIALFNKDIEILTNINCYCLSDVKVVDERMMIDFIFYMIIFF